jgi:hypothetical protein
VVSSTLLWTRSLADLRANAPFQRIRFSWLLLLQILAVLAIAFAVAQPEAEGLGSAGGRHVLMIDRSASMNTLETVDDEGKPLDPPRTRLSLAKDAAKRRVRELLGGGWFSSRASDVMIVTYGLRAEIRAPFTDSIAALETAIDGIAPTDEVTKLGEAIELARAFTTNLNLNDARGEENNTTSGPLPTLELYSDGRIADLGQFALRDGEGIVYHRVGVTANNVAVVGISADRPPEQPDRIQVFAALVNPEPVEKKVTLQLAVNSAVRVVTPEPITVPAAKEDRGTYVPGRAQAVFRPIEQRDNAAIEVAVVEDDALRDDDAAIAVVPPARRLSVLLVSGGSFLMRTLLEGLSTERFTTVSLGEYEAMVEAGTVASWDVVVFDAVVPKALPGGRYLVFGTPPPVEGLSAFGSHEGVYPRVVRDEHPLFRSASLDELSVSKMVAVQPDKRYMVLVEAPEGPLILTLDRSDLHLVYVAFDPLDSNWPFRRSFVNFVANAIEHLGRAGDSVIGRTLVPGEAIALKLPAGSRDAEITLPDGSTEKVAVDADGNFSWGPVALVGLYRIGYLEPGNETRQERLAAVNIGDANEARIEPRESLDLGTTTVQGVSVAESRRGALWPWILGLGLLIVLSEWWYYQRQIRA